MAAKNGANGHKSTNGNGKPGVVADVSAQLPGSTKAYVEGDRGIRVPVREIALSGGEPPLRVYDTSGPRGYEVRAGLPRLRESWIHGRGDVEETPPSYRP